VPLGNGLKRIIHAVQKTHQQVIISIFREGSMRPLAQRIFLPLAMGLIFFSSAQAQTQPDSLEAKDNKALKIFIDCELCGADDFDYIRTEIAFVNYVRDRKEAQVHVLLTTQETGSGGTEFTITFIGQHEYAGNNDTLEHVSKKDDTDDVVRQGNVRVMKLGLIRYVAKTPQAEQISIAYNKPAAQKAVVDKWNYWVFNLNLDSFLNGQKSTSFASLYGSVSANRVTPAWKINLSVNANYYESNFDLGDRTISSFSRGRSFRGFVVKSLDGHWSAGLSGSVFSSTYNNTKLGINVEPAVEYNLFRYAESTRRQLRFLYRIGYNDVHYDEETIYDKNSEVLINEELSITLDVKQPWGSVRTSLEGSNYFHGFSKNRVELFGELSLRLFKGVSFRVFGDVSRIRDQLSLPKGGASSEEILLQRRQLATQYSYFASIGLSYTFGSIYNNVVNPRFGN
jgi:hypothetical protein